MLLRHLKLVKKKISKRYVLQKKNYPKSLNKICDVILPVTAERVDRIQEIHIFIGHSLCEALEENIK